MKISEIMSDSVGIIDPESSLTEAARKMRTLNVGALPVCDGLRVVGMLTDRDIAVRAVAEGEDPDTCKVSDVMSPGIAWCYEDQDQEEAGRIMSDRHVRRLIVVDRQKKLKGIVTLEKVSESAHHAGLSG